MSKLHREAIKTLKVSQKTKSHLLHLTEDLQRHLGENLRSCCVYGSAARGEWREATSDLNFLLILDEIQFDHLDAIGDVMVKARKQIKLVPMLVTPHELRRASDVYCIKFDDIKRHHVAVMGDDPFREVEIHDDHMRFVCEFELRNIMMRMRQFFLQSYGTKQLEQSFLMRFFTSALFPLRAMCGLLGLGRPLTTNEAIEVIEEAVDTDCTAMKRLYQIHHSGEALDEKELTELYQRFNQIISLAVDRVDAMEA